MFLDGNKVDKQVLAVDGSSYLPVRAISESLGLEVVWNGEERAIYLSNTSDFKSTIEVLNSEIDTLKEKLNTY